MNSFIEALFFLLCGMCSQSILQRGYNKFHKGSMNDIGVEKAKLRQDMSCEATGTKGGCGGGSPVYLLILYFQSPYLEVAVDHAHLVAVEHSL